MEKVESGRPVSTPDEASGRSCASISVNEELTDAHAPSDLSAPHLILLPQQETVTVQGKVQVCNIRGSMEQGGKGASLRALWSRSSGAPHHESNHVDTGTNQLQQDSDTLVAGSPSYLSHLPPRWSPNQKSNVNSSFRSTEDASYFPSSPSTSSRMYHQNPVGSPIGQRSSPYQSPIERPVSIDRTSPSLIPKELPQRRGVRTNMYSHASLPRHHPFNFPSAAPGEGEKVGSAALGGDVLDPDDQVLFQRDPESAPRRNHTIATASMPHHRRLDQHFQQSSSDHINHAPLAPGMLDERDSLFSAPKRVSKK